MTRLKVTGPLIDLDGDEMTREIWRLIKERLIFPYLQFDQLMPFDLGLPHRVATGDQVTHHAAAALKQHGLAVKCATITPDKARKAEFDLADPLFPSPNGTLRNAVGGCIFREPILVPGVQPFVRTWRNRLVIGRNASLDIYKPTETRVTAGSKVKLVIERDGQPAQEMSVHEFTGDGVVLAMYNLDERIREFAEQCVSEAIRLQLTLWFGCKNTISKVYHERFAQIFTEVVAARKAELDAAGIKYEFMLIDNLVAAMVKTEGGVLIALMNYDGDVQSDFMAAGAGSLGLMTSYLQAPGNIFLYEAAHGTVTAHWRKHEKGERTSTNSIASIFAWSGALRKRGELDGNQALVAFAGHLEQAVHSCIRDKLVTGDMCQLLGISSSAALSTQEFISHVGIELASLRGA